MFWNNVIKWGNGLWVHYLVPFGHGLWLAAVQLGTFLPPDPRIP